MLCRDARKMLAGLAGGLLAADEERVLREHLSCCPDCARLFQADQMLTHDIGEIRRANIPHPMSIDQVRDAIALRDRRDNETTLGVRIMRQVSDTIYRKPRLSLAAATVFVLLLASILVPVRTAPPGGYEVAFAAPVGSLVLNPENAEKMLVALDITDAGIESRETDSGVQYRIAPLRDSVKVRRLIAVLDSLGGRGVRTAVAVRKPKDRTIWQLLLKDAEDDTGASPAIRFDDKNNRQITINLKKMFSDDFVLWMPMPGQSGDSLRGLLLDRQGEKTNLQIVGETGGLAPDDCGWHQYLNNSIMHTETPDGDQAIFDLYDIEDVRELEKMGYNFATMKFESPGQIPIPGMGPKLNKIDPNPFADKTVIEYMIPQASEVRVQVLDTRGRQIRTLLDCMPLAGIHQVTWDGLDTDGNPAAPGTYVCRFTAGDYAENREITLAR